MASVRWSPRGCTVTSSKSYTMWVCIQNRGWSLPEAQAMVSWALCTAFNPSRCETSPCYISGSCKSRPSTTRSDDSRTPQQASPGPNLFTVASRQLTGSCHAAFGTPRTHLGGHPHGGIDADHGVPLPGLGRFHTERITPAGQAGSDNAHNSFCTRGAGKLAPPVLRLDGSLAEDRW